MPRRKPLEQRVEDLRCGQCRQLTGTPLAMDEEAAMDALLNAIKDAVAQAPQDAIMKAAESAPRAWATLGVRGKPRDPEETQLLFIDASSAQALIAEIVGEV